MIRYGIKISQIEKKDNFLLGDGLLTFVEILQGTPLRALECPVVESYIYLNCAYNPVAQLRF